MDNNLEENKPAVAQSRAEGATSNEGLCDREQVISLLVAVARAAYFALDDSEEVEGDDGRCALVPGDNIDALSDALDALDELPEPPGLAMTGPAKAEWALRAHNPD